MSPSHVLTCSASSPHQPDALKAKGDRDMMMTFGFLNENVSFHICSQEIPPLFLVLGGYNGTAIKRITAGSH